MATIFFSYSHKDEQLRDEMETHLAMLKRDGSIEAWHDRRIAAGDVLDTAIDLHLEKADVFLPLVSPDFLASRYCYDIEVKRAMERHEQGNLRVIPVILRPCDWKSAPFSKLLVTPKDGIPITKWPNRDEAFLDVVRQIRAALPKASPMKSAHPRNAQGAAATTISRSSNLRLRKQFTDADKDHFLDEAFEFMARFFEHSLVELTERNSGIEGRFKRIDATLFSAVIYRDGKAEARCSIRNGGRGGFGSGVTFSHDDRNMSNSFNESLSVEAGEQALTLKPMGMTMRNRESHLTMEGAAEFYWSLLIESLQR